jgi:aspartate/methionine/tyrosine aminotransferase
MDVLAEATKRSVLGHPVISMAVGQPAHPVPAPALLAARKALEHGRLDLKAAIVRYYARRHGVAVDPRRIAVTTGSSAAFNLAFLALFDRGDRVVITRPGYPAYRNILRALGLDVVEIPVGPETGFTLTPAAIEEAGQSSGRIAGVLLASPANPTGTVTGRAALEAIAGYCGANDIAFISDEIYHGLTYSGEETSAVELTDEAVVINSFSKYYCMTGWRVGWMVLPEALVRPVERIAQSLYISAPELSQIAAEAAFSATDELDAVRDGYRRNRALLARRLPEIGFSIASPMDGAFYAYADIGRFSNDSMTFARTMLETVNVAATPGPDFDPVEGHRTMRFSYAGRYEDMEEALNRLHGWLAG